MPAIGSRFARIFQRLLGSEETKSLAAPEPWLAEIFGIAANNSITVTPRTAMKCAPVRAAVQALAEPIGQLPVHVYRRNANGAKERDAKHPAYKLLHDQANDWTSAGTFREELTRDALLYPNGGFAHIVRNANGKPIELHRIDQEVTPVTVDRSNFEPVYSIAQKSGQPRVIPRSNILHIPSPSLNGCGLVHEGSRSIRLALVLERHALRLFEIGAKPAGIVTLKNARDRSSGDTKLAPSVVTLDKVKEAFAIIDTPANTGGTVVLPGDVEWKQMTLTNIDAQFLELRTYAIHEISRIFHVPPHMLMELGRATWSNATQMRDEFLSLYLMSWIKRWEGEVRLKLFTPEERETHFAEFLTDDFARADLATRMDAYGKAITNRILSPNEVRAAENRAGYPGGDTYENPNTSSAPANSEAAR